MTAVLVALVVALALARTAHAEEAAEPTIVLVADDAAFVEALRDALATRRVRPIGVLPSPALAELGAESRRIAEANHATGTVWLSPASGGATIVTYDRTADRFLVRELAYTLPLSPTQAAEAARMVRTMLRALRSYDDDVIVHSVPLPPASAPPQPRFSVGLGVGAWFAAPEAYATPQMTLAIAWRPHDIGAAITATFAPASDVTTTSFAGNVRDIVVAAEARRALTLAPGVRVTPGAGLSLHAIVLEGGFGSSPVLVSRRFDPAAHIGVTTSVELPHALELGLGVSADCLLRRQRYEAGSERILIVPRVQLMMAGIVAVRF
jgi:hypothetical protein